MPSRDMSEQSLAFQLGGIQSQLETIAKTQAEDRMAGATYRTEIRKEIREGTERMQHIEVQVNSVLSDVAEMKPKVSILEQRMHMSNGAAKLAVVLSKAAHILSAAVGGAIVIILDKLVFHK